MSEHDQLRKHLKPEELELSPEEIERDEAAVSQEEPDKPILDVGAMEDVQRMPESKPGETLPASTFGGGFAPSDNLLMPRDRAEAPAFAGLPGEGGEDKEIGAKLDRIVELLEEIRDKFSLEMD